MYDAYSSLVDIEVMDSTKGIELKATLDKVWVRMVTATRWYLTMSHRTTPTTLRYTTTGGVSGIGQ